MVIPSGPQPTNSVLQVCLSATQLSCTTDNTTLKDMISRSLSSQLQSYCEGCQQLLARETRLVCNNNRQQLVFRIQLSVEQNDDDIYQTVRQWIVSPGAFLRINGHVAWIDTSCPVLISSLSSSAGLESGDSSAVGAVSGVLTTLLLLVILALVAACVIVVFLWMKRKERSNDDYVECSQPAPVQYKRKPANDSYEYLDIGDEQDGATRPDDSTTYEIPDIKNNNWRNSKAKKKSTNASTGGYQNVLNQPLSTAAASKGKKPLPKPDTLIKPTKPKAKTSNKLAPEGNVYSPQQQVPPTAPPQGVNPIPNPPPPPIAPAAPPPSTTPAIPSPPPPPPGAGTTNIPKPPPPPGPPSSGPNTPNPPPPPPPPSAGNTPIPNPPPTTSVNKQ